MERNFRLDKIRFTENSAASDKDKESILNWRGRVFREQKQLTFKGEDGKEVNLDDFEVEKNSKQKELIGLANARTNDVLKEYGFNEFDISDKNVHVVSYDQFKRVGGFYSCLKQAILLKDSLGSDASFYIMVFHEMIHLKSFHSALIDIKREAKEFNPFLWTVGLSTHNYDKDSGVLNPLNEAVVSELEKAEYQRLRSHTDFKKSFEVTSLELKNPNSFIRNIDDAEMPGKLFANRPEDILFFDPEDNSFNVLGYPRERRILGRLVDKIFSENKDYYKKRKQAFDQFVVTMLGGDMRPLTQFIEKTYGKGFLRKLAKAGNNLDELERLVATE